MIQVYILTGNRSSIITLFVVDIAFRSLKPVLSLTVLFFAFLLWQQGKTRLITLALRDSDLISTISLMTSERTLATNNFQLLTKKKTLVFHSLN